jgi:hypothetical protein
MQERQTLKIGKHRCSSKTHSIQIFTEPEPQNPVVIIYTTFLKILKIYLHPAYTVYFMNLLWFSLRSVP